jgi:tetratricopeptide (TPR) repeat protein
MNRPLTILAGLLWFFQPLGLWAAPATQKPQLTTVAKMVARGQYPAAIQRSRTALKHQPRALGMRALLGIALARSGRLSEALPHLEATAGVMAYVELGGYGAHADALRAAGSGQAAWAVRRQRLGPDLSMRAQVQTMCQGVDDLLAAGESDPAITLGRRAVDTLPDSPAAHAFLASALLWAGRHEEAGFHHWRSKQADGRRISRVVVNALWLSEQSGDLVGGFEAVDRLRVMRPSDVRVAVWSAAWLARQGRGEEARTSLGLDRWKRKQHPNLEAERFRLAWADGDAQAAQKALKRLTLMFPHHPDTRVLFAY